MVATTLATVALAVASYIAVCGAIAQRFTTSRRQAPLQDVAGVWGAHDVSFMARDGRARIDGWYLAAPASHSAVLFVHGKDACRGDELKSPTFALARSFAAAGFAVLMIDLRGHGTSSRARLTYGATERHDVLGAVDWLRALGHQRIGVLGASMGAATTLLAAADEPAIAALVLDSAFVDFGLMIQRQYRKLSKLPIFFLPGALALGRLLTGHDLRRVRPIECAAALVGRPVLVIHSEGDRFIPAEDALALARASGAELWTTDTTGHLGSFRSAPAAYAERVIGFFSRHLPHVGHAEAANDAAPTSPAVTLAA